MRETPPQFELPFVQAEQSAERQAIAEHFQAIIEKLFSEIETGLTPQHLHMLIATRLEHESDQTIQEPQLVIIRDQVGTLARNQVDVTQLAARLADSYSSTPDSSAA